MSTKPPPPLRAVSTIVLVIFCAATLVYLTPSVYPSCFHLGNIDYYLVDRRSPPVKRSINLLFFGNKGWVDEPAIEQRGAPGGGKQQPEKHPGLAESI